MKVILCLGEMLLGIRNVASHEKRIDSAKSVQAFFFHFQRFSIVFLRLTESTRYQHDFRKCVITQRDRLRVVQFLPSFKSSASKFLSWHVVAQGQISGCNVREPVS